jgi:hypothetical protein
VKVKVGNAVIQALTLPKQFLAQVQRALCLGRNCCQLIERTKKTRRVIRIDQGETLAGLATLEFRIELNKEAMKRHGTRSAQQIDSLADLHSSLERRRNNMETLDQAELKLNDELKEGPKKWEQAWLSFDKTLNHVDTGAGFLKPYYSPDDSEDPRDSNGGSKQVPSPLPALWGDAAVKHSARPRTQHTKDHSPNPPQNPQEHDETRSAPVRIELHKAAADAAWEKYINHSENFNQELDAHAKRSLQNPEARDKYRREIWIPEVRRLSQLND